MTRRNPTPDDLWRLDVTARIVRAAKTATGATREPAPAVMAGHVRNAAAQLAEIAKYIDQRTIGYEAIDRTEGEIEREG